MVKYNTACLYIAGVDGAPIKIGHSHDTVTRAKHLERETQGRVTIMGKWPVGSRLALAAERYVHWQFKDRHVRGEWFNVSVAEAKAAILDAIAKVTDRGDMPPPLVRPGGTGLTREHHTQIQAALHEGESRFDFIRKAVETELKARGLEREGK